MLNTASARFAAESGYKLKVTPLSLIGLPLFKTDTLTVNSLAGVAEVAMSLDEFFQKNPGMKQRIEDGRKILEARKKTGDPVQPISLASIDETLKRGHEAIERSRAAREKATSIATSSFSENLRKAEESLDQTMKEYRRMSAERFALTERIRLERHEAEMARIGYKSNGPDSANKLENGSNFEQTLRSEREEFDHVNSLRLDASLAPLSVKELRAACQYAESSTQVKNWLAGKIQTGGRADRKIRKVLRKFTPKNT